MSLCTRATTEVKLERDVEMISAILGGTAPIPLADILHEADMQWGVAALWAQAKKELYTLLNTNVPNGTIATTFTAIGFPTNSWVWP